MPHPAFFDNRTVIAARVDTPHGPVTMVSAHLTTQDDATIKADQAAAAYQFLVEEQTPLAGFLAGDLNATPDSAAMRFLRGEAAHMNVTATTIDVWQTAQPDDPGLTAPADDPQERIDYIYLRPGTESTTRVIGCDLVLTEPVAGLFASDHLGIVCQVELTTPGG
jgi:endonuclease/exonuclease/phosphatase family metal-dependent hydrolase